MGLEDAGPQLGRIDSSSLIGRADTEVVSPRATAALADAFRQGFVTVDDIMERVGERAQLKKKADIMQLQESMSPLAIEARKNAIELASLESQAGIDLAGAKKEAARAEYRSKWANAQINTSGLAPQAAALQNAGWLPPIPEKGIDNKWQEEVLRRWGVLQDFNHEQQQNAGFIQQGQKSTTLKQVSPTEWQGAIEYGGKVYPAAKYQEAVEFQRKMQHPAIWEQSGRPQAPIFGAPGKVEAAPAAAPAQGTAAPAAGAQQPQAAVASAPGSTALAPGSSQPIINVNLGGQPVSQLKPNVMVSEPAPAPMIEAAPTPSDLIQPVAQAPAGPLGVTPEGTFRVSPEMVKTPVKAFTEPQQKALIAQARSLVATPVLESPGFNPGDPAANLRMKAYNSGTLGELVTTLGPSKAKITEAERNYANAANQWIQGLLRVESGAAISTKEQGWYEKAFFPSIGDTPAVQKQKADARKSISAALESVITGHQSADDYSAMRDRIGQTVSAPGAAGAATTGTVNSYKTAQEALASGDRQFWLNGKLYTK